MPDTQALTLLGFDFGEKRIGIAVGQTLTGSVTPLTTLSAVKQQPDWAGIEALLKEWQPDLLIVGLPLHMDGSEQTLTQRAKRFGNQLKGVTICLSSGWTNGSVLMKRRVCCSYRVKNVLIKKTSIKSLLHSYCKAGWNNT